MQGRPDEFHFRSVDETILFWTRHNGCNPRPKVEKLPDAADDDTTAARFTYAAAADGRGRADAEVILVKIEGGGHTWPGRDARVRFLGPATHDVIANDLIWAFFQRHPLPK